MKKAISKSDILRSLREQKAAATPVSKKKAKAKK